MNTTPCVHKARDIKNMKKKGKNKKQKQTKQIDWEMKTES